MPSDIVVTDHALVRYLERHLGLSLDEYRKEIAALALPAAMTGAESVVVDNIRLVFSRKEDHLSVVTILSRDMEGTPSKRENNQQWEANENTGWRGQLLHNRRQRIIRRGGKRRFRK